MRKEKKWFRGRMFTAFVVVLALVAAGCGGDDDDDDAGVVRRPTGGGSSEECGSVTVGSTNFSEQFIVASMFAQVLEARGCKVDVQENLGAREVVFPALEAVRSTSSPSTSGPCSSSSTRVPAKRQPDDARDLRRAGRGISTEDDLVGLDPSDAQDRNALGGDRRDCRASSSSTTVSDLESVAGELIMGGPPECPTRPLCLQGYESVYGLNFKEFKPLDAGGPLTFEALENGDIQVALVFSTQGQLEGDDLVVLEEDKDLQPAENVLPVIRNGCVNDTIAAALISVSDVLTTEDLISLNKQVDIDLEDARGRRAGLPGGQGTALDATDGLGTRVARTGHPATKRVAGPQRLHLERRRRRRTDGPRRRHQGRHAAGCSVERGASQSSLHSPISSSDWLGRVECPRARSRRVRAT